MSDPTVARWKQSGDVYLWRRRTSRPRHGDWNISASEAGCESLLSLLDLMENGQYSSQQTIRTTVPRILPDGYSDNIQKVQVLALKYPKGRVDNDYWEMIKTGDQLTLTIGANRLAELRASIRDLRQGGGDYHIGSDESPLWIWWFMK